MEILSFDIRDLSESEYEKWYALMATEKKAKIDRFRFDDDKKRSITGEMLIKSYIRQKYGTPAKDIIISTTERGKPYTENCNIHFNISHSGDMVVCAVSDNPIGVDIEKIKPVDLKIAKKVFNNDELLYLFGTTPPYTFEKTDDIEILRRFFTLWTTKEAYVKFTGTGISENLKELSIKKDCVVTEIRGDYVISVYSE